MSENFILRQQDLIDNPTTRVPICLCLDVSGSMRGDPIDELNSGVQLFYDAIRQDEVAYYSAEICIVTFGGFHAECKQDFSSLEIAPNAPEFNADGGTPMGEAVIMALKKLEQRKQEYKDNGIDYFQPWLVLMTDGQPNDNVLSLIKESAERTAKMVSEGKLTIFPIGIGKHADMSMLKRYSPKLPPLRLQGLKFREFFAWLSASVSRTSQSTVDEQLDLDWATEDVKGWAEL